jgi:1-phosphofructokinase family hexose kinase
VVELTMERRLLAVAPNPSVDRLVEVGGLRRGEMHRPASVTVVPGGKGLNVARVAADLGVPVTAVGLLGGHAGRWIEEGLIAEGIDMAAAPRGGETRTCTSVLDRTDGSMTELYEAGGPITNAEWGGLMAAIAANLADDDVGLVTVSGSLPPGAPDDGLARIIAVVRSFGPPVALDGHGRSLALAVAAHPWLVKVNLAEARAALEGAPAATLPADLPPEDLVAAAAAAVHGLVRAGAGRAIVTIGTLGSVVGLEDGSAVHVRPPTLGRYPVGSGDAFLAGLSVATLRGDDLRAAVVLGTAAAAANALVPGAGRLETAAVKRLCVEIAVEPVR